MKSKIITYTLLTFSLLGFTACSDDDGFLDKEKPIITINKPTDHQHLHNGDILDIDIDLSDNVGLSTYKIDIHFDGDGHQHKSAVLAEWSQNFGDPLHGKTSHKIVEQLPIPDEITTGHYHFGIHALDTSGNEEIKYIEIEIVDHDHDHND